MRIGLIAPPWVPVPPARYGGTEVIVDNLARGLTARGHDVELFTVGTSTCPVRRHSLFADAAEPMGTTVEEAAHVLAAYEAFAGSDLIHDHTVLGPLLASRTSNRPPVVATQHAAFTPENRRIFAATARRVPVVAISHSHARSARGVDIAAVIHHGIDLDTYRPGPGGDRLGFIGRMSPDKGAHRAIRIARAAGRQLVIASKIRETVEREYFDQAVRPLLGEDVELWIEPGLSERVELLRTSAALLNPISWTEPFGLVMVEALASGTPVLAFPNGAAPEIVEDGCTGYLCADEQAMVNAVHHVDRLDRGACRTAAEQRFAMARMCADYDRLYRSVVSGTTALPRIGTATATPTPATQFG